jgi:hypothetical protein
LLSLAPRFFLVIVCPLGHNTSVPRKRSKAPDDAPERLTALYHQLQGVMPLLRDIVQPGNVEEGTALYASSPSPSADAGSRYRFEKRGKESWAVLDSRQGDALLALTKYKKGAEALVERLEAYERFIAQLPVIHATPHHTRASDRPAFLAPQGLP